MTTHRPSVLAAALLLIGMSQTGCATLITATACIASKADNCGPAIGAAATVDAVVLEAAARSSEPSYYEYESCDELICYADGDCYCAD